MSRIKLVGADLRGTYYRVKLFCLWARISLEPPFLAPLTNCKLGGYFCRADFRDANSNAEHSGYNTGEGESPFAWLDDSIFLNANLVGAELKESSFVRTSFNCTNYLLTKQ